jgi:hypothetical protein
MASWRSKKPSTPQQAYSLSIRGHVPSDRKRRKRSGILGHFWAVLAFPRPSPCSASLLAAVVVLMLSSAGQAASSQCTNTESVLFTCRSGKNVISVCASQLSADAGLVQYRFGPEGAPDIRLPLAAQDWRTWTRAGMLTYAGGRRSLRGVHKCTAMWCTQPSAGAGARNRGWLSKRTASWPAIFHACKNRFRSSARTCSVRVVPERPRRLRSVVVLCPIGRCHSSGTHEGSTRACSNAPHGRS